MLRWALIFLIIALVAGVLGLGVVAGTAAWIARVLFIVFIMLFLVSVISGAVRASAALNVSWFVGEAGSQRHGEFPGMHRA